MDGIQRQAHRMKIDDIEIKSLDDYLRQCALDEAGFYTGKLDGDWGPVSRAARTAWEAALRQAAPGGGERAPDAVRNLQMERWQRCSPSLGRRKEIAAIITRILSNQPRYQALAAVSGVPWRVIAALHNMESSGSFSRHLHEGSPLTARTRYVPKGRPLTGSPPFTWEESALDALRYDHLHLVEWSDIPTALQACERYNGLGYQQYHPSVPSPYLWAASTVELPGKYVADGEWSSTARSQQIGVATLWKALGVTTSLLA